MNRTFRLILAGLIVAASLNHAALGEKGAGAPIEPAAVAAPELPGTDSQEDTLYAQGTKAMDEQRWTDAVTAFDKLAAAKGKRADAGLYWKAYSLNKLGRKEESAAVCSQLRGQYANSTWNKECRVLQVRDRVNTEVRVMRLDGMKGQMDIDMAEMNANLSNLKVWTNMPEPAFGKHHHETTEDDIKILALHSLMQQDPAKAMPLLRALVRSDKPIEVRKQALFVLSRSKQPEAQTILTEIATSKAEPELQREAIQILAMNRGKDAGPTLVEIYRNSTDAGVKRAALSGLFMVHDAERLVELAKGEKDLNLKRDIVAQLAMMKDQAATDYMLELLK